MEGDVVICTSRENEVGGNSSLRQNGTKSTPAAAAAALSLLLVNVRETTTNPTRRDVGLFSQPAASTAASTAAPHALLFSCLLFTTLLIIHYMKLSQITTLMRPSRR